MQNFIALIGNRGRHYPSTQHFTPLYMIVTVTTLKSVVVRLLTVVNKKVLQSLELLYNYINLSP